MSLRRWFRRHSGLLTGAPLFLGSAGLLLNAAISGTIPAIGRPFKWVSYQDQPLAFAISAVLLLAAAALFGFIVLSEFRGNRRIERMLLREAELAPPDHADRNISGSTRIEK
jgi:hypothetical protein